MKDVQAQFGLAVEEISSFVDDFDRKKFVLCYLILYVGPRWIVLKNFIFYKYKTYTLSPFVKPCKVLNVAVQNVF